MSRMVRGVGFCCAAMAGPAMADGLAAYSGTGTVHVLDDGRVVISYTSPSQEASFLEIESATSYHLISDGTTSKVWPPDTTLPSGTVSSVQLNGTSSVAVGQFSGSLAVTSVGDDMWEVTVHSPGSSPVFDNVFEQTGTSSSEPGLFTSFMSFRSTSGRSAA